jgi:ATP-dependent helicase/nuclease subunit B
MEGRGKIDRVERHETTGEFRVLDFKTSAKALDPMKAHVQTGGCGSDALDAGRPWIFAPSSKGTGRWINLQLPLYCLALRDQLEIEQPVSCGYFNLPSAVSESRVVLWQDLTEETLACSRRCAEGVVDAIRNGVFWPPAERLRYEDFDALFFGSPEAAIEPEARPVCILP